MTCKADLNSDHLLRAVVSAGVPVRLPARGGSMWPTVLTGDSVIITRATAADLALHDLALVEIDGRLHAHRLVACHDPAGNPKLEFRGDANSMSDALVGPQAVVGRVSAIEPGAGLLPLRHLRTLWLLLLATLDRPRPRRLPAKVPSLSSDPSAG